MLQECVCGNHDFARICVLIHDFGNVNKSSKTKEVEDVQVIKS